MPTTPRSRSRGAAASTQAGTSRASCEAAERAGADLREAVRAVGVRPQADGRVVVETDRGPIIARDVLVATNGYTDGAVPALRRRVIPIGSYIIATEVLPEDLAAELSPKGGCSSTPRTSCSTGG